MLGVMECCKTDCCFSDQRFPLKSESSEQTGSRVAVFPLSGTARVMLRTVTWPSVVTSVRSLREAFVLFNVTALAGWLPVEREVIAAFN